MQFELVSRQEATARSDTGKRTQIIQEYVEHVQLLGPDQAGRITLSPGDTMATVRRRLGAAIKATGKNVQIKRVGADIYFCEEARGTPTQECHNLRPLHLIRKTTRLGGHGSWIQGWLLKPTARRPRLAARANRRGCAGSDWNRCGRDEDQNTLAALVKGARSEFLDSGKLLHKIFFGAHAGGIVIRKTVN